MNSLSIGELVARPPTAPSVFSLTQQSRAVPERRYERFPTVWQAIRSYGLPFELTCGCQTAQPAGQGKVEQRVRLRQRRLGSAVHVQRLQPPELLR
jgi:hypothetical protein